MKRNQILSKSLTAIVFSCAILFTQCKKKEEAAPQYLTSQEPDATPSESLDPGVPPEGNATTVAYTIKADEYMIDNDVLNLPAGSVIAIESGTRGPLYVKNFKGTASAPFTFINKGGKVTFQVSPTGSFSFKTDNCSHFVISGSGSSDQYGIEIAGGNLGLSLDNMSTNFEVHNLEIHSCGFAGIMAKTDPRCDGSANKGTFTMQDIKFHHNYIHNVGGEGFYIGNSFYSGWTGNKSCSGTELHPHDIHGVRLHDNIVKQTGWDGIQVGCASADAEIYNNLIEDYGMEGVPVHSNGIQLGEGTTGKCYNNIIKNGKGHGIILLGLGGNEIYNNLIINPNRGVFADSRVTNSGTDFAFYNNTIVNPTQEGFLIYSNITQNKFYNNIVTGADVAIKYGNGASGDERNNFHGSAQDAGFVSATDFRLAPGSKCIDQGITVDVFNFDLDKKRRPAGGAFDIGAYEF
ncbi:MAG: right-handed parallel beta-helix repeat-containing protein [Cytophagaceae bacterium]